MQTANSKLSIIVPVYNVEKFLRRCIESLLNQNYKNFEIILVDDGSTDSSGEICDEYVQKYNFIKVVHQNNKGLSGARNAGLQVVSGEYVGFIDSDDWIEPNFYSYLMSIAEKKHVDVVSGTFQRIESEKQIKKVDSANIKYSILQGDAIYAKYLRSAIQGGITYVPCCSKVFRHEVLNNISFDSGVLYEDIAFCWKAFGEASTCAFCEYPGYYYFVNKKSITKSLQRKFDYRLLDYTAAAEEIKSIYLRNNGKNTEVLDLLDTFISRTHYSVLFKMIRSKCSDKELVDKEIEIVKNNYYLLKKSSMSPLRKILLYIFKVVPKQALKKYIVEVGNNDS